MYSDVPPEVELLFIDTMEFSDLVSYAHSCQKARDVVQALLQHRCQRLLKPYLDTDDMDEFWRALNAGRGGIKGPAAVWVTQLRPIWRPRHMDIVVGHGGEHLIRSFFLNRGWTEETLVRGVKTPSASRPSVLHAADGHPSTPAQVDRLWRFSKPDTRKIVLTETMDRNVFEHLTGGPHTMNTMLLTSSTIIALHAFECIHKLCIWRRRPVGVIMDSSVTHVASEMGARINYMSGGPSPCRSYCPGILRRLRGGRGVGVLRWRAPSNTRPTSQDGGVVEEYADRVAADAYNGFAASAYAIGWTWCTCENPHCATFLFPRNVHPALPVGVPLSCNPKEDRILRTAVAIRNSQPPFPRIYQGLLFATSCPTPFVVPVPLDHGLEDYRFPDDLRTYTWITRRIPGTYLSHKWCAPYEVIGGITDFATLVYKFYGLLMFMASAHEIGPVNVALGEDMQPRPVCGDVLVMVELDGKIVNLALESAPRIVELMKTVWNIIAAEERPRKHISM
ncbi:hypothetical protein B0H12DRAFT_1230784 [Mycena haematopus]|nr:hypothetical protein B0H12DRAFT_1230784 [Mycena haematopus]